MLQQLPSLKETVEKYELLAKKSLGQNFLLDKNITDKIIRSSLEKQEKENFFNELVVEVGPGPGGLTRSILEAEPFQLIVIEMDSRCIQIMNEIKAVVGDKLNVIEGDALRYNFSNIDKTKKCNIVSNLPYNISVPLLIGWLKNMQCFDSLTLMFQKEVAERITAEAGNKNYGRLSVLAQITSRIKPLFNVNPNCFVPAPKIWSTVLLFQPLGDIPDTNILQKLEKITELAFGQRRKMLRQSLKTIPDIAEICRQCAIDMTKRAEDITPQQYLVLAKKL